MTISRTQVAIVGAGPAGLLLSHLLAARGIDSVVLDTRSREDIETTIRAGILEHSTVDLLAAHVPGSRVMDVGKRHDGIELRFEEESHRIDFAGLTGRGVWLYPQHEVLKDLIAARVDAGQDLRFGWTGVRVEDSDTDRPRVVCADDAGVTHEIEADAVIGADGSHSIVREAVVGSMTGGYFREYPFAWFGILCEAPPSAHELIYSNSPNGFALVSQRSPTVQRMYFQCDPDDDPDAYTEEQLWETLQSRVPGTTLHEGPIFQRDVLRFRSFVAHRLHKRRTALVGDAAHTVPPTGAKGMNLAIADVVVLDEGARGRAARRRRATHGELRDRGLPPHLEGPTLLVVDDEHAPRRARRLGLRPAPPGRGTARRHRVRVRPTLPGRGVHGLALRRRRLGSAG